MFKIYQFKFIILLILLGVFAIAIAKTDAACCTIPYIYGHYPDQAIGEYVKDTPDTNCYSTYVSLESTLSGIRYNQCSAMVDLHFREDIKVDKKFDFVNNYGWNGNDCPQENTALPTIDSFEGMDCGMGSASGSASSGSASGSNTMMLPDFTQLTNPLKTISVPEVIGKVVRAILAIIGAIALIMFVYGGFVWMTAAGNEQSVERGRNTLIWATLGLIIIFASYILVRYVMEAIGAAAP
ncbi:MAG: hypothetical protein ABIG10_04000 [bacterium]